MYTQCPSCSATFRVTADVLRVAGGRVRCGSCGAAFNALNHLSEQRPEPVPPPAAERLPELRPDAAAAPADSPPPAMEQTAADSAEQNGRDTLLDARLSAELATTRVDEVLSDTPTPLDEVLADDGLATVDSAEVFAPEATTTTPDNELRFDDDTGLPDDYDASDEDAPAAVPEPTRDAPAPLSSLDVDLGLDNPDEWRDLLDEVGPEAADEPPALLADDGGIPEPEAAPAGEGDGDAMTLEEELDALDVDLGGDDDEPAESDELVSQMEALSLELSGLQEELDLLSEQTSEPTIADELAALDVDLDEPADAPQASFKPPVVEAPTEHVVPPPTEEEETINRLIDQDLLALAVEDDDGMASTIAFEENGPDAETPSEFAAFADRLPDDASSVETIVMEGDIALSGDALDEDLEPEPAEAIEAHEVLEATPAAVVSEAVEPEARNWRMLGGIAALGLLLALQGVHFSRHTLATVPALYSVLEPVYAAVGQPLNPAWDVTGWRFEATRGSTDEAGEMLTIYSRIGNNSEAALPYPVISVALTDRFEETIGNRVLEPADYLGDDVDSGRLVPAGTTFNASIAIESPADAAMGFKLNVCYRQSGDRLRCAIEDFRD